MPDCKAAIRPLLTDVEVRCEQTGNHGRHKGTLRDYAYPGSATTLSWLENDRRCYHGEWPGPCQTGKCTLPQGHQGNHAE